MFDRLFREVLGIVSFVIESYHCSHAELLENRNIVVRGKNSILYSNIFTPYLSMGFLEGELKAINFLGTIQFRSPF